MGLDRSPRSASTGGSGGDPAFSGVVAAVAAAPLAQGGVGVCPVASPIRSTTSPRRHGSFLEHDVRSILGGRLHGAGPSPKEGGARATSNRSWTHPSQAVRAQHRPGRPLNMQLPSHSC
jgi:hypothetical protein